MDKKIYNLPNALTIFRFPAGLALLWLLMQYNTPEVGNTGKGWVSILIAIFAILAFLSDLFDGKLARKHGIVTNFGKMLDPVADSMLFTLLMLGLAMSPRFEVSIWFTVIMLYREAGVQIMRRYAAVGGVVLMAGWAGKAKMFVQCIGMGVLAFLLLITDLNIIAVPEFILSGFAWWASALSALVGMISLALYIKQLPEMMKEQASK